jgi:hypothetical protein
LGKDKGILKVYTADVNGLSLDQRGGQYDNFCRILKIDTSRYSLRPRTQLGFNQLIRMEYIVQRKATALDKECDKFHIQPIQI